MPSMKAIRIIGAGDPDVLVPVEVEAPRPGPGEALVRVRAAGLNRADLLQRRGAYPAPPGVPADIPGLEIAGEVVEPGPPGPDAPEPDAPGLAVGDRVMGIVGGGGYAELATVPRAQLMPVPEDLSWAEAAAVPEAFLTAADALFERGGLMNGEAALIHSAGGGVGTAALQLARAAGASRIFGTASRLKLDAIRDAGLPLDAGVDYRTESFAGVIARETDGRGVDVIVDTVGADYWADNLASLALLGRLVLVGLMSGARAEVDLARIMRGRLTVVGTVLRSRSAAEKAAVTRRFSDRFLAGMDEGLLRPILDRTFPLERAADAHRHMEENRNFGNIVLLTGNA